MALGLVIGREKMEDKDAYVKTIDIVNKIRERFKNELKEEFNFKRALRSTLCREIQKRIYGKSFNLKSPESFNAFLEAGAVQIKGVLKFVILLREL